MQHGLGMLFSYFQIYKAHTYGHKLKMNLT